MAQEIDLSSFSADELDILITQAAAQRATLEPAHPAQAPEQVEAVVNPAWFTFSIEHGSVMRFRHPGLGWVSFLLPPPERAQLLCLLLNQALVGISNAGATASASGGGSVH
jgi:hypothetical protein